MPYIANASTYGLSRGLRKAVATSVALHFVAAGCTNASVAPKEELRIAVAGCAVDSRLPPAGATTQSPGKTDYRSWVSSTREIPGGFAGFRRDSASQAWLLMLADTSQIANAREVLLDWQAKGQLRALISVEELEQAEVRSASWSLFELYEWLDFVTPKLLAPGGPVRGVGVNEQSNRITVSPENQARDAAQALITTLPVPCNLLVLEGS